MSDENLNQAEEAAPVESYDVPEPKQEIPVPVPPVAEEDDGFGGVDLGNTVPASEAAAAQFTQSGNVDLGEPAKNSKFPTGWPFKDIGDKKLQLHAGNALGMLMVGMKEIDEQVAKYEFDYGNQEQDAELPAHLMRLKVIMGHASDLLQNAYFNKTLNREGSQWAQFVEINGEKLRAGKANLSSDADPVMIVRNEMGLGGLVQVPLWHSGIWVTLRTPTEASLLELEQRISMEKTTLGRTSNGLVFSATEVYIVSHLIDFIFEHVYAVNLPNKSPELLAQVILATDIPQLVWGMAAAIYPSGYPLLQPCIANPETCDHVVEELLNIGKISFTDSGSLTDQQKTHMRLRGEKMTMEKISTYQGQFVFKAKSVVEIADGVFLKLRVPNIAESRDIGYAWVDQIAENTKKAFAIKMGENQREAYIRKQAALTSLRQYGHWIEAITTETGGKEREFTDRDRINELLESFCSDNTILGKAVEGIANFIDATTITMIALPKFPCPKCQGEPDVEYLRHPNLIPLDIVNVFFILLGQRISGKLVGQGIF